MADSGEKAADRLEKITECSICMSAFTDPRMLPCIHTFCFNCLFRTGEAEQKRPGDKMHCPLCRKDFTIPPVGGMAGLQKNSFIENLTEVTKMLRQEIKSTLCDICKAYNEVDSVKIPEATVRCLECRDNFCDRCSQVHKVQKLSKTHKIVKIDSEAEEENSRIVSVSTCIKHIQKSLDYYCADCKKIVCVSCFVESHKLHNCKDVSTVDEEFRQTIENHSLKISTFADEILSVKKKTEMRKADFLKEIDQKENAIRNRREELKNMIDEHYKSLLDELFIIKSNHLKEIGIKMEEVDRYITILRSFESYCTTLRSKGSAGDICSSVDEIVTRADELHKDYKEFIRRPLKSVEVYFQVTDLQEVFEKSNRNVLGQITELTEERQSEATVLLVRSKAPTIKSYARLLTDIYRLVAQARNDHSKVTLFSKEEVVNLHGSDFLENVQRELGLSQTDKKWGDLQKNHTKMASLLFELTRPTTESSSKKLEILLNGLQSSITKQWHTIQFLFRCRNSGKSLTPKGLQNHGNTCYFNSVMQCLLQTVSFSFELTLNLEILSKEFTLKKAYTELVSKYSESKQRNTASTTLYQRFTRLAPRLNDARQRDSHDLLIHFLDRLRIEERNVCKSFPVVGYETAKMQTAVDRIFGGQFISVHTCHTCEEPYAIHEPFLDISLPLCTLPAGGKKQEQNKGNSTTPNAYDLRTPFSSKSSSDQISEQHNVLDSSKAGSQQRPDNNTGNDSYKREVIKNMMKTLTVEPTAKAEDKSFLPRIVSDFLSKPPNISQCLQYFTRAEEIDSEYLCRHCQPPSGSDEPRLTSATKRILISSPPAILVLHLKRFEQKQIVGFVKRDEMIPYEELLDLGPFCSCSAQRIDPEEENVWYSLYAVVVHRGQFYSGGHYIAYVKERDSSAHLEDHIMGKFLQKKCAELENIPNDDNVATMEKRKRIAEKKKAERPDPIHGQWYYICDELVRLCDANEAFGQKAFLLFYERIPGIVH